MSIIALALVIIEPTTIMRLLPETNIIIIRKEFISAQDLTLLVGILSIPSFVILVLGSVEPTLIRRLPLKINTIIIQEKNLFDLKIYNYSWEISVIPSFYQICSLNLILL